MPEPLFAGSEDEVSVRKLLTDLRRKSLRNEGMAAACRRGLGARGRIRGAAGGAREGGEVCIKVEARECGAAKGGAQYAV